MYLDNYLNKIICNGNSSLANAIAKTASEIGSKYIRTFTFFEHKTGLLFGNVQSGKTAHMFGVICEATDNGFPVCLILTTDNIALQQQTLQRAREDLKGFCICGEEDSILFAENNLEKPAIVVLKKNTHSLKLWTNIFCTTDFMKGNPLLIIDDEADAASLNTLVNKNRHSTINKYIDIIKTESSSSLYLQVTGTPHSILLQTKLSGFRPEFIYYFSPGPGYLGGDFFFPSTKPKYIHYNESLKNPTLVVVVQHLLTSSQILLSGGKVSNCLIHPSIRISEHNKIANDIISHIKWCISNINGDFVSILQNLYADFNPSKSSKYNFESLYDYCKNLLINNKIKVIIMNGRYNVSSNDYSEGCNFIIGGNTLGRGVTFPSLQTIYYTRSSKKPQADTIWQHSRMFGYDRDKGIMNIYIDRLLYKHFADINSCNNAIIAQIKKGLADINIKLPNNINPTRKNVLDNKHVDIITGGTNYFPVDPDNDDIEAINNSLSIFDDHTNYYQVNLMLIRELLGHIIPSPDFKLNSFISIIDSMLAEKPTQGILIVRRNRDVAQGTGALLSSNDWVLSNSFTDKVVLTFYQVTGLKGWRNNPLWVPNIKLPENIVYYNIED